MADNQSGNDLRSCSRAGDLFGPSSIGATERCRSWIRGTDPEGTAPTPFLEVKANRDLVLAALLVVTASASQSILAFALLVGAVAPAADAWIVSRHGKISGTAVHLGALAYMVVAAALAASGTDMFFATVLACHVLAAIGVGPIFTLPFLANTPAALHAVPVSSLWRRHDACKPDTPLGRAQAGSPPLALPIVDVVFSPDRIDCVCARAGCQRCFGRAGVASPHPLDRHWCVGADALYRRPHGVAADCDKSRRIVTSELYSENRLKSRRCRRCSRRSTSSSFMNSAKMTVATGCRRQSDRLMIARDQQRHHEVALLRRSARMPARPPWSRSLAPPIADALRGCSRIAQKAAVPIDAPIERANVTDDVAAPMSRASAAFCVAVISTGPQQPIPQPRRMTENSISATLAC